MHQLSFAISDVRVELHSDLDELLPALDAVWARCRTPLLPTTRVARFEAVADGECYVVRAEQQSLRVERREDVLPVLESALYRALPGWHAGRLLLHAACVRSAGQVVLLVGRSGAGKSSLALAAVRRGFDYFSDELTVVDGGRVWGVPRALQFEPVLDAGQLAPWLLGLELAAYRLRLDGERRGCLPLWLPPARQVPDTPAPARGLHVYAIERAARSELAPCSALEALAVLHEAAFAPPQHDLGALLRQGGMGRLRWHEPDAAIDLLEERLAATRASRP